MKTQRLNELLDLLGQEWKKEPDLHLMQLLLKIADESGHNGELVQLTDDILIYQLKMRGSDKQTVIPGLKKDYEADFKTAILRARGVISD